MQFYVSVHEKSMFKKFLYVCYTMLLVNKGVQKQLLPEISCSR